MMYLLRFFQVIGLLLPGICLADNVIHEDAYIAGYATGVLQREFKISEPSLSVHKGIITLPRSNLENTDPTKVLEVLSAIPGVTGIETPDSHQPDSSSTDAAVVDQAAMTSGSVLLPTGLLPTGHLFKPLLADPRWAHFSAAYHYYNGGGFDGTNIATVSFGETIPFYRSSFGLGRATAQWEAGIQAGVFSDFNWDAPSSDLINTDFIASAYSSLRVGEFSAFGRIYHQSSHLGDEFLLRTRIQRVNLSYEGADLRLSYELPYGVRLYGGGGGLFHREPSSLKPWSAQYGIEFRSPWRMDFAMMRPVAAADFKNFEQNNWSTDISARAGVQFDSLNVLGRNLQILAEYFNGHSPSGQFYNEKIEYFGLGAHFHF
ncbi:conserved hypothetical protein [Candidatus Methylobacter favarea]|uniref:DUF1207 domain-containing protein n=2 Tax=Candidatus Methylobacter favarea TaxID=2707345 RepID=A0A8S0X819_9GAMM|nr:conserved hypothetical protein [Candidatus Methylobacter favarea]